MKVIISPDAAADIEIASRWWSANRPAAPRLFVNELSSALALIAATPDAGAPLRAERLQGVRRVPMPRTRYLLYYRVVEKQQEIRVLRVWHASRRGPPRVP